MARNRRLGVANCYLHPKAGTYQVEEEIVDQFWYHPFYPIYLKDIENQETEMKLDAIVPAFTLFANQKKQFWSNVITAGEYAADVVTTLSGVGNLAEVSYTTIVDLFLVNY